MARTLSSAWTFFLKFIFSAIWITAFGGVTLAMFVVHFRDPSGAPPPEHIKWLFLTAWLFGSAFIYWSTIRLKRVRMDDQALYISNFRQEIRVELRDIASVSENRWVNSHPITVEFHRRTEFGDRVVFMPTVRWWAGWRPHPIVAELREAARRAAAGTTG
jgi:hypothetical protein